jgi:hypothetical protein
MSVAPKDVAPPSPGDFGDTIVGAVSPDFRANLVSERFLLRVSR